MSALPDQIAKVSTLKEALALLNYSPYGCDGVLRIIAGKISGRVGIFDGKVIVGALITATGEDGEPALEKLLEAKTGVFQFFEVNDRQNIISQNLNIEIGTVLPPGQLLTVEDSDPILEYLKETGLALTDEQLDMFAAYQLLSTHEDKAAFQEENPDFVKFLEEQSMGQTNLDMVAAYQLLASPKDRQDFLAVNTEWKDRLEEMILSPEQREDLKRSKDASIDASIQAFLSFQPEGAEVPQIDDAQLMALRGMYADLATQSERQAFMQENPGFAEAMVDRSLTESQMAQLEEARKGAADADIAAFVAFQDQILGEGHPPLSAEQMLMLQTMFHDLSNETTRRLFLEENPVLSDEIPVLRGDQIPKEPEPEPLIEEAPEPIDTSGLVAVDMYTGVHGGEGLGTPEQAGAKKKRKKKRDFELTNEHIGWVAAVLIFSLIATINYVEMKKSENFDDTNNQLDSATIASIVETALTTEIPGTVHKVENRLLTAIQSGPGGFDQVGVGRGPGGFSFDAADLERADRLMMEGKIPQAIELYSNILSVDPYNTHVRIALVESYIKQKNNRKARQLCISGIKRSRTKEEREQFRNFFLTVMIDPEQVPKKKTPPKT